MALALIALAATAAPAGAAIGPISASEVLSGSAVISGSVDTEGVFTLVRTEINDGVQPKEGEVQVIQASDHLVPFEFHLNGLKAQTKYQVSIRVDRPPEGLSEESEVIEFTTLPADPPTIISVNPATEIGNTVAKVSGSVERPAGTDPGFNANCKVEYITDAAYQPQSERQVLTILATGGTYTLSFGGQTSAPVAFDASAGTVQAALEGLSSVGAGAVAVSGGPGDETGANPYAISFTGALAAKNVEQISVEGSALAEPAGAEVQTTVPGRAIGFEGAQSAACQPRLITAGGVSPVQATLSGLAPKTTYHYRLAASNAGGTGTLESPTTFTTGAKPVVQTLGAGGLGPDSATLTGRVNPQNSPVTYQFEWGETTDYGHVTPAAPEEVGFADESLHLVTEPLSGLKPGVRYHYQLRATNTETDETAVGADQSFEIQPAVTPPACSNEASRAGPSAGLPDCRAFELTTSDLNNASLGRQPEGVSSRDGQAVGFRTIDSPSNAEGNSVLNFVVAKRGASGWRSESILPPFPETMDGFNSITFGIASEDLSQAVVFSSQHLAGADSPSGASLYLRKADRTFVPLMMVGNPYEPGFSGYAVVLDSIAASKDFSHIFYWEAVKKQLPAIDPAAGNLYEWTDGQASLVGILPGGTPASDGARLAGGVLPAISDDGEFAAFVDRDPLSSSLYLREHETKTVEVNATQRTEDVDPNPPAPARSVGTTADGSAVLFTSASELTNDANTGPGTDSGADLYSYDVKSKVLTDLTVDSNPVDAPTGADVQRVVGASPDASYIYLIARGQLAPGAISGEENLYVEHEGVIRFVAPAGGLGGFYLTPDGKHAAILSTDTLTGYDSAGKPMAYEYSYPEGLVCASCRPDGTAPTAGAGFGRHALSNDGARLFFQSKDAIVPHASAGTLNVFEYVAGEAHLLTQGDGTGATLLDASASGDDVFIATHEELSPGTGENYAVYDARVGGEVAVPQPPCLGEGCRGAGTAAPAGASPGSASLDAPGEVVAPKSQASSARKLKLRVSVPGSGQLTVSGKGLKTVKKSAPAAGPVALTIALKSGAEKTRLRKGVFKTTAQILFTPTGAHGSPGARAKVSLKFEGPTKTGSK